MLGDLYFLEESYYILSVCPKIFLRRQEAPALPYFITGLAQNEASLVTAVP